MLEEQIFEETPQEEETLAPEAYAEGDLGEQEKKRIVDALAIYEGVKPKPAERPYPPEPEQEYVDFWKEFGLENSMMILSVVGSVLISALTVGSMLFISELRVSATFIEGTELNSFVRFLLENSPVLFLLAGMAGFEGYAVSHGISVGKRSKEIIFSNVALVFAFIVMCSTGFLRSLALLTDPGTAERAIIDFFTWAVIFSTAVGAPVVVYYGSKNIGVFINQKNARQDDADKEYEKKMAEWQNKTIDIRNDHLNELEIWHKGFWAWYKQNAEMIFGVSRKLTSGGGGNKPKPKEELNNPIQDIVSQYLQDQGIDPHQVGPLNRPGNVIAPKQIFEQLLAEGLLREEDAGNVRVALTRLRKQSQ